MRTGPVQQGLLGVGRFAVQSANVYGPLTVRDKKYGCPVGMCYLASVTD